MGEQRDVEAVKQILATEEALGIICYDKHHHHAKVSCTKLSELLKIPINRVKDTCAKMEEMKIIKMNKTGYDIEVEIIEQEDSDTKELIDQVIWEHKNEYGVIYKKLITSELLDFMGEI